MSVEERIYTVPLARAWVSQKHRRAERAVSLLRAFAKRHMKPTAIIIDPEVNEEIWSRGIRNPPRRIRVRMSKDSEGVVTISPAEGS